jgi:outer membrane biosynthesis protein TonB
MPADQESGKKFFNESQGAVIIEEVVSTRHSSNPPPPPKPLVPVPVPNDEIIPEKEINFEDVNLPSEPLTMDLEGVGQGPEKPGSEGPVENPQQPPQIRRIVEPIEPEASRKAGVKAEIMVSMLVDVDGNVADASVTEVRLYTDDGNAKVVDSIGYGLVDATLKAAFQWKFRPARQNEQPVATYTNQAFSFGF